MKVLPTATTKSRRPDPVTQFSVFTPNRVGRLHDLLAALGAQSIHVLAMTVLDTTESSIIRLVSDNTERTREILEREKFAFTESKLVVVEAGPLDLNRLLDAMLEAELNINYLYSFLPQPDGKPIIALSMEDNETGEQALKRHQFRILKQADILR